MCVSIINPLVCRVYVRVPMPLKFQYECKQYNNTYAYTCTYLCCSKVKSCVYNNKFVIKPKWSRVCALCLPVCLPGYPRLNQARPGQARPSLGCVLLSSCSRVWLLLPLVLPPTISTQPAPHHTSVPTIINPLLMSACFWIWELLVLVYSLPWQRIVNWLHDSIIGIQKVG